MSIDHAILGILSCKALTGYDIKKVIQDSPFMYWSGNNNQIYKSLLELQGDGYVTGEVYHQESSPSKKVYTITEEGLAELREWAASSPEPPEYKKTFLVQLAWADMLDDDKLSALLSRYETEVRMQLLMLKETHRRRTFYPGRSSREMRLWDLINENLVMSYESELRWLEKLRSELAGEAVHGRESRRAVDYEVVEKGNFKYICCGVKGAPIGAEQDALDIVAACMENGAYYVLLDEEALSEDFFKLKSGLAGKVLQKFVNYRIKTAVVLKDGSRLTGRFKELISESNKRSDFRVFTNLADAESWLAK